ncbi:MAG: methyl-accepting chemotaxis protein [Candidatus Binatia bacterium]
MTECQETLAEMNPPCDGYPRQWGAAVGAFLVSLLALSVEQLFTTAVSASLGKIMLLPLAVGCASVYVWYSRRALTRAETVLQQRLAAQEERWQAFLNNYRSGLPVLRGQLSATAAQVEQAVVQVCEAFSGIAARAQDSVAQSERYLRGEEGGQDTAGNLQDLMETARVTLKSILDHVIESATFSMRMVYRMEDVERGMEKIVSSLKNIEQIANRTKLLALNTTIEAARFSGQRKGFTVIAAEITKLAERSTLASDTIRELVRMVNIDLHNTYEELRHMASCDMSDSVMSREEVEKTISLLNARNEVMQVSVKNAIRNGQALADDVAQAVIGMQFQDTVNQRITHVVEALTEMHEAWTAAVTGRLDAIPEGLTGDQWAERMQQRYTMASERYVATERTDDSNADGIGNNVELF